MVNIRLVPDCGLHPCQLTSIDKQATTQEQKNNQLIFLWL